MSSISLSVVTLLLLVHATDADVVVVSTEGSDDLGDGSAETPFATLAHAITVASAVSSDITVHVVAGVYEVTSPIVVSRPVVASLTVVGDGALSTTPVTHFLWSSTNYLVPLTFLTANNVSVMLSGILFEGPGFVDGTSAINTALKVVGTAEVDLSDCVFHWQSLAQSVNVVASSGAVFTADSCQWLYNNYVYAASVALQGVVNAVFTNCTFAGNNATQGGAAIGSADSAVSVVNCHFVDNNATLESGGAIFGSLTNLSVVDCLYRLRAGAVDDVEPGARLPLLYVTMYTLEYAVHIVHRKLGVQRWRRVRPGRCTRSDRGTGDSL